MGSGTTQNTSEVNQKQSLLKISGAVVQRVLVVVVVVVFVFEISFVVPVEQYLKFPEVDFV